MIHWELVPDRKQASRKAQEGGPREPREPGKPRAKGARRGKGAKEAKGAKGAKEPGSQGAGGGGQGGQGGDEESQGSQGSQGSQASRALKETASTSTFAKKKDPVPLAKSTAAIASQTPVPQPRDAGGCQASIVSASGSDETHARLNLFIKTSTWGTVASTRNKKQARPAKQNNVALPATIKKP